MPEKQSGADREPEEMVSDDIIPVSRSLFLCESCVPTSEGRVTLTDVFAVIRAVSYPHTRRRLVVFVQLSGGEGETPLFFEIRRERDDELVRTTTVRAIHFTDRVTPMNVAMNIEGLVVTEPGVYSISLFCHNTWVCDTTLTLI